MDTDERLKDVAERLNTQAEGPIAVSVREFLSWFGAQRRGFTIVSDIREALSRWKLRTEPDFESVYIDAVIELHPESDLTLAPPPITQAAQLSGVLDPVVVVATATVVSPSAYGDPTYSLKKLEAANRAPVSVKPDEPFSAAVTKMMAHDYSQLPIMTSERELKGIISWQSIGSRLATGITGTSVRDFKDDAQEISGDESLFQAIPRIVQHQYVLVRGDANRITGIVTATDLSVQFQKLTEPFLLLSEIENHVRRMLEAKFSVEELAVARDSNDPGRQVENVADMTLGEFVRLLQDPARWEKLNLRIDRTVFCGQLDRVRTIRNDVMHFDSDGIGSEDLDALRKFAAFLQRLKSMGVT